MKETWRLALEREIVELVSWKMAASDTVGEGQMSVVFFGSCLKEATSRYLSYFGPRTELPLI